ncbi:MULTISPECIES: hypothetical protein [Rhodanobacteraceae]|uniref:hypothetical protein n=1 Tax=Rhodanobacteraceae TaxID=1775411 RepID=UPI000888EF27|nr:MULTISPECIES: hypothetical protein [Rhodanobacteraceae]SDG50274.1 hypothetical protein SAMN04515659_2933 [Dyella sp. 333MFSha]SKB69586.1 hypothetical protein SAMN05660880_02201 [Luteibacter sp. 22Crub2.1]
MTPRQWFALVLRYLGASSILTAISYLLTAYNVHKGLYAGAVSELGSINHTVVDAVLGLGLLIWADRISAFFVPAQRPAEPVKAES